LETNGFFEEEYYKKFYRNYTRQNPPKKIDFYRKLVKTALGEKRNPSILEAGCAFGTFLSSLENSWRKYGFDISEFAIREARKSMPKAELAVSAFPEIPFKGPFDVIVSFDVLEHVPEIEETMLAVKSRLVPNGHFIFVVPVYDGPTGPIIRILDKDTSHIHRESRAFWLNLTERHFQIESWCGIYRFLFPGSYYLHKPTMIFRRFSPAIAVVARNIS